MVRTPQGVRNAFHPLTGPRGLEWLNPHWGFFASSGRAEATEECTTCGEDVGGCKAQVTAPWGQGGNYGAERLFLAITQSDGAR